MEGETSQGKFLTSRTGVYGKVACSEEGEKRKKEKVTCGGPVRRVESGLLSTLIE